MNNDFWNKMEEISQIMTELEEEHKKFFSTDEQVELLNYKHNFIESCLFWNNDNNNGMSNKEKEVRIRWEYNNMFDKLVKIIDNNVEEWENLDDHKNEEF
jgi:hypothetical protein